MFNSNKSPMTFVLLHGSWHDGSAWSQVAEVLRAKGHSAYTPTLAGHGPDGDRSVGFSDIVDSVEDYINERSLDDFILVSHSFSGTVIQALAERMTKKIRQLVFANSFVLLDGETLQDALPEGVGEYLASGANDDGGIPISFELFLSLFKDGTPAHAAEVFATLTPSPRRCWTDRVSLQKFSELTIPKAYVYFTDDGGPSGDQDPRYHFHPKHTSRLGEHDFVTMPGDHEAIYTDPVGVAKSILAVAKHL